MTTTIPVPRDVAREFVQTRDEDSCGITGRAWLSAGRALRAALLTAAPTLLDEPAARVEPLPAMTAELLAALLAFHNKCRLNEQNWQLGRDPWDNETRSLLDAIERAGIVQPRPTDAEIAAAVDVLTRAGRKVTG